MTDSPLDRALQTVQGLKPGTWESIETLATVALAARGRPEAVGLLTTAEEAAAGLRPGTWQSVRALALLALARDGFPR